MAGKNTLIYPNMSFTLLNSIPIQSLAGNPMAVRVKADDNWQNNTTYAIRVSLEVEPVFRSGSFTVVDQWDQDPEPTSGEVIWDFQHTLESYVRKDPPAWPATLPRVHSESIKRYRYTIYEIVDGSVSSQFSSNISYVLRGALHHLDGQVIFQKFNQGSLGLLKNRFLTHAPRSGMALTIHQPYFLSMLNTDATTLRVLVEVVFSDSTSEIIQPYSIVSLEAYDVLEIPVGYEQLKLGSLEKEVSGWGVYVSNDAGTVLTEKMNFLVTRSFPYDRYWLWENSFGCYEVLRTYGINTTSLDVSRLRARRSLSPLSAGGRQFRTYGTTSQVGSEVHSGFLEAGHEALAQDFLQTEDLYRIGEEGPNLKASGTPYPLEFNNTEMTLQRDEDPLVSFKFEVRNAFLSKGVKLGF